MFLGGPSLPFPSLPRLSFLSAAGRAGRNDAGRASCPWATVVVVVRPAPSYGQSCTVLGEGKGKRLKKNASSDDGASAMRSGLARGLAVLLGRRARGAAASPGGPAPGARRWRSSSSAALPQAAAQGAEGGAREGRRINLFTAVNEAMHTALETDERALVFGEVSRPGGGLAGRTA